MTANHYLVGRLGGAKIAILKSSETTDDGVPIWNVVLQEAPQKQDAERETRCTVRTEADDAGDEPRSQPRRSSYTSAKNGEAAGRPAPSDDQIPF